MSFTTMLIIANVAVFVVGALAPNFGRLLQDYGHFSTYKLSYGGGLEFWRLISFQFLHDPRSVTHVLFNMIGLYTFGRIVEEHLGFKTYAAFYLICGIFGGVAYALLNALGLLFHTMGWPTPGLLVADPRTPLIGASAGVFGVIIASARLEPNTILQVFLFSVRLKIFAYGYVIFAALNLLLGGRNAGGDAAHLGGAIAGFFFIGRVHLLRDFFDVFNDSRKSDRAARKAATKAAAPASSRFARISEEEIDRILAKAYAKGVHNLTEKEKKTLAKATDERRRAG
jgi:membrane associated rhomboid family serine protease